MTQIKATLPLAGLTFALINCATLTANAQQINNFEDYKLWCSKEAHAYNIQSSECPQYRPVYEEQLLQEEKNRGGGEVILL